VAPRPAGLTCVERLNRQHRANQTRPETDCMGRGSSATIRTIVGDGVLDKLQLDAFGYFLQETNPRNGLVPDSTREGAPSSIAAVGLALAAYAAGAQRGFLTRDDAIRRVLATLRFFWESPQGQDRDAVGYKGFFYHFLDVQTGQRAWESEVSTIDTTFLLAGALAAATYFDRDRPREMEITRLADALYRRVDWHWALDGGPTVAHAWTPERGFLKARWEGYSEAILLYALGLGSPTYPLPEKSYEAWTRTYRWKKLYGQEFLYAGPLFIHQLSHIWIDFRGINDDYMRARGIDYFENSRRATFAQQQYAIRNPRAFKGYGEYCWGLTGSAGPGPAIRRINGHEQRFYDYKARGIPYGPDDGTVAPWAAVASLPFAPEIVLPTIRHFGDAYPRLIGKYGLRCSFNPTFRDSGLSRQGWHSQGYYGLELGPIVLMIENFSSGFLWTLMKRCPYLVTGLRRAGFTDGWLSTIA
jgi:hypothetical protein